MEKKTKAKENKRNKTAIRLIGRGKERKITLLYVGHCKLKLIQINQVESNQMQVLEESGKPGKQKAKVPGNKKQKRRAENQQILSQINDNLSYKETL